MGKKYRKSMDYERELQDAIKRFGREPLGAKNYVDDYKKWHDFLIYVLGVNPEAVESERGQSFWNAVADGIAAKQKPIVTQPTEDRGRFFINKVTHHISYRNKKGQWTSYESVGLTKSTQIKSRVGERVYTNPKTSQTSYRDVYGRWTKK